MDPSTSGPFMGEHWTEMQELLGLDEGRLNALLSAFQEETIPRDVTANHVPGESPPLTKSLVPSTPPTVGADSVASDGPPNSGPQHSEKEQEKSFRSEYPLLWEAQNEINSKASTGLLTQSQLYSIYTWLRAVANATGVWKDVQIPDFEEPAPVYHQGQDPADYFQTPFHMHCPQGARFLADYQAHQQSDEGEVRPDLHSPADLPVEPYAFDLTLATGEPVFMSFPNQPDFDQNIFHQDWIPPADQVLTTTLALQARRDALVNSSATPYVMNQPPLDEESIRKMEIYHQKGEAARAKRKSQTPNNKQNDKAAKRKRQTESPEPARAIKASRFRQNMETEHFPIQEQEVEVHPDLGDWYDLEENNGDYNGEQGGAMQVQLPSPTEEIPDFMLYDNNLIQQSMGGEYTANSKPAIATSYEDYNGAIVMCQLPEDGCYDFAQCFLEDVFNAKGLYDLHSAYKWHAHTSYGFIDGGDRLSFIIMRNAVDPFTWNSPSLSTTTIGCYGRYDNEVDEIHWRTFTPIMDDCLFQYLQQGYFKTTFRWHKHMHSAHDRRFHRAYWLAANRLPLGGLLKRRRAKGPAHDYIDETELEVEPEVHVPLGGDKMDVDNEVEDDINYGELWPELYHLIESDEEIQIGNNENDIELPDADEEDGVTNDADGETDDEVDHNSEIELPDADQVDGDEEDGVTIDADGETDDEVERNSEIELPDADQVDEDEEDGVTIDADGETDDEVAITTNSELAAFSTSSPDADEVNEVDQDQDGVTNDANNPDDDIDADGETVTSFPQEVANANASDAVDASLSSAPERATTPWFTASDLQSSWIDGDLEDHEIEGTWADICHEAQFVDLAIKMEHTVVGCSEWEIDVVEGDGM